jgi:hypothetical protein
MTDTGTYLYAITRAAARIELAEVRGVVDAPVRIVGAGDLACVVSTVGLDEFGEEALRANLEDLGWLEKIARQHDSVVQFVARQATTVPLRLATVCRDDSSAVERVQGLGGDAQDVLATLDGREEWGVKVFDVPGVPEAAEPERHASGTAYLQQRRKQLAARAQSAETAARDADAVYAQLAQLAVGARRHRLQDPQLTGIAAPMVLNAAFLVDRRRVSAFRAEVAELAAQRAAGAIAVTGPWPPYSFVTLEQQ